MAPAVLALSVLLAASLALALLLTALARRLAPRCQLLDRPDGRRKLHAHAVPAAGGFPLLLALGLPLTGAALIPNPLRDCLTAWAPQLLGLLAAAAWVCAVGTADDLGRLRGRHKLAGQLLATAVVIAAGFRIDTIQLAGRDLELGLLAVPFTAFVLLGAMNALNLLDGMDGLLTVVALIATLALAILAATAGHWPAAALAVALAGALLGFLRYNFPPASIFLGDSGSLVIGLVVGVLVLEGAQTEPGVLAPVTLVALLAVPVFDTLGAILRRKLTGRSVYETDRSHLHHCLLRRGLSPRQALLGVAGLCLLGAAGALTGAALGSELPAAAGALAVVGVLVAGRIFGHAELGLAGRRLGSLAWSLVRLGSAGGPREERIRLQGSVAWQELWESVTAFAERLNLAAVRLDVNAPAIQEGYHARWDRSVTEAEETVLWRAEVPLVAHGRVFGRLEIQGVQDDEPVWRKIALLARLVEDCEATATVLTHQAHKPAPPPAKTGVSLLRVEKAYTNERR